MEAGVDGYADLGPGSIDAMGQDRLKDNTIKQWGDAPSDSDGPLGACTRLAQALSQRRQAARLVITTAATGLDQRTLAPEMQVDASGTAESNAYTAVVKHPARWFLLPHEAAHALSEGMDLTLGGPGAA
jgi:hypothetical protein